MAKSIAQAACHHATLVSFLTRVERVLRDEVIRWYRAASGVTIPSDSLRVKLKTAVIPGPPPPPPQPRRAIATD